MRLDLQTGRVLTAIRALRPWVVVVLLPILANAQEVGREQPQGRRVSVRITHAEVLAGQSWILMGDAQNLPYGAEVRVAVRDASGMWQIIPSPAKIEGSGQWKLAGLDLQCRPSTPPQDCEVIAFVATQGVEAGFRDDAWLRRNSLRLSDPLRVQDIVEEGPRAGTLTIEAIAEQPANSAGLLRVPAIFSARGRSELVRPGSHVWMGADCGDEIGVVTLAETLVAPDGTWKFGSLSLPLSKTAQARRCLLIAFAATRSPPGGSLLQEADRWSTAHSLSVVVESNAYHLRIVRLTAADGQVMSMDEPRGETKSLTSVNTNISEIEVVSDPLPSTVYVAALCRPEGRERWLWCGDALNEETGRWRIPNPWLRQVTGPIATRWSVMAVATSEPVRGRALTIADLDQVLLGKSAQFLAEIRLERQLWDPKVAFKSINGTDTADSSGEPIDLSAGLLNAWCTAKLRASDLHVFLGIRAIGSELWKFERAATFSDGDCQLLTRVRTQADPVTAGQPNGELVVVTAEELPAGEALETDWWKTFTLTEAKPLGVTLPSRPWFRRMTSWFTDSRRESVFRGVSQNYRRRSEGVIMDTFDFVISLLWPVLLLTVLGLVVYRVSRSFRRIPVIFNARRDANGLRSGRFPRYRNVIESSSKARIRAMERKFDRRIEPKRVTLRAELQKASEISAKYDGLCLQTKEQTKNMVAFVQFPRSVHNSLLAILTFGEAIFNFFVFDVFLQPLFYTASMSLAVAVSIPVWAFSIGLWVRQWTRPYGARTVKLVVSLGILAAAFVGINKVRIAHLMSVDPEFLLRHPDLNSAFLPLNAFVLLGAAMVTYWAHHPIPGFAEITNEKARVIRCAVRLERKIAQLESEKKAICEREREVGNEMVAMYDTVYYRHADVELTPDGRSMEDRQRKTQADVPAIQTLVRIRPGLTIPRGVGNDKT